MEILKTRYAQLLKAYSRLSYMTKKYSELSQEALKTSLTSGEENELIVHREALIKRFEFCYELTWKFLKIVLREKHLIDVASPRKVFQECYHQGILSQQEMDYFFDIANARNETTHIYDESVADAISKKILDFYPMLMKVVESVKPE